MRIGIDLGGTKIEALALDNSGRELIRRRLATPQGQYRPTVEAIRALVADLEQQTDQVGTVGVGIPGAISPASGLIKNANSTCLNGRPLQQDLETALGRPVRLANDANCFALSEARDGAGAGARVVFGVILGTGVGGGIVVDGQLLTGPNAIAGEWGHNPLPWPSHGEWPGPACYCTRTGCIETFLSGPAVSRSHRERTGVYLTAETIAARATNGDATCQTTIRRFEERLARALALVVNILDPDRIVLGGGLSNISSLYRRIPRLWEPWVFSDRVDTPILPPKHGASSGVRGAAWLWPME